MAANPNTFGGIPETWNKEYQITHSKMPVYPAISNYRLAAGLKKGDTTHRSYASTLRAKVMGADGSYSTQAVTDTDETLVIDKEYETSVYIKSLDELQNSLPVRAKYARESMVAIFNQIDGDVLGLYDQFTQTLDDGDMGGTAGNGVTITTANVKKMFFTAKKLLQRQNILMDNGAKFTGFKSEDDKSAMGVAVISPDVYQNLLEALDGKDTAFGDVVAKSGHAGMFANFNIFNSNSLGWSAVLALATNPTDGDTITINGVVITFVATLSAASGATEVHIASTVDITRANLAEYLNAEGADSETEATDTGYSSATAAEQLLLANITATNSNSADTLSIKMTGWGSVAVSETLTAGADVWTAAKQVQHCLFGVANAIDVVLQKEPSMEINPVSGKIGKDIVTWTACGYKVFNEAKAMMIDAWVRTDAY